MYTFFEPKSPRMKLLKITPELLLHGLLGTQRVGDQVKALRVEGCPEGCEIQAVTWNEHDRCFMFRVTHPSFEEVPSCHSLPELHVTVHEDCLHVMEDVEIIRTKAAQKTRDIFVESIRRAGTFLLAERPSAANQEARELAVKAIRTVADNLAELTL